MPIPNRHILQQGPVLSALARAVITSNRKGPSQAAPTLPGPEERLVIAPRPRDLVRDYVRHVGGEPNAYRNTVPPHLFPQWIFPLVTRSFEGLPYPMQKAMNGGCRITVNAPLPGDEPLQVSGRLQSIDDNGRRAVLQHRGATGTSTHPEALVSDFYAIVPLGGGKKNGKGGAKKKDEKPRVPQDARELARWRIGSKAGLEFAKLTGDFNPIHWIPGYARAFGFRNVILHGFSTMARAMEGLNRGLFSGDVSAIRELDCRFTRPLVLPAQVGLYVRGPNELYVGDAPGGPAYLTGTFDAPGHRI
jgi:acyl dehydratase